jgi:DNA-binding response OmpR family regulator
MDYIGASVNRPICHSLKSWNADAFLTERILGRTLSAYDRSIDTHISNLRRKLVDEHGRGIEIRNIRGAGYLLTGNREGQT